MSNYIVCVIYRKAINVNNLGGYLDKWVDAEVKSCKVTGIALMSF